MQKKSFVLGLTIVVLAMKYKNQSLQNSKKTLCIHWRFFCMKKRVLVCKDLLLTTVPSSIWFLNVSLTFFQWKLFFYTPRRFGFISFLNIIPYFVKLYSHIIYMHIEIKRCLTMFSPRLTQKLALNSILMAFHEYFIIKFSVIVKTYEIFNAFIWSFSFLTKIASLDAVSVFTLYYFWYFASFLDWHTGDRFIFNYHYPRHIRRTTYVD